MKTTSTTTIIDVCSMFAFMMGPFANGLRLAP